MKKKDWLKILIFAVIIAALTVGASFFLRVPEARDTIGMNGFYLEEENSIDVILIGPSPVYTDFYSPLAYEQEGFTSYALATGRLTGKMYLSAVREALAYQKPKLFVFDLSAFSDIQTDNLALRRWIDSIQNKENREQSIQELVSEEEMQSYRIPFLKFHSNWPNMKWCWEAMTDKADQRKRGYSITKNFTYYTGIDEKEYETTVDDFDEDGMKALEELLAFLKECNIENALFIRFPFKGEVVNGDHYQEGIDKILYAGFDVLDYWGNTKNVHKMDLHLEPQDYHDQEHLTIFGTEKVTKHLAAFIAQEYGISGGHTGSVKDNWDTAASYNQQILSRAEDITVKTKDLGIYMQKAFLKQ